MNKYILRIVAKGIRAYLVLQTIKGIRLAQIRQLFRSYILLITNYAILAWYRPGKRGTVKHIYTLEKVQRLGARTTLRA
jgi:hypothetical protein